MHQSSDKLLDSLRPLFDDWVDGRKQQFTIQQQTSFGIQFSTESGFSYNVDHEGVVVIFNHKWRIKPRSGGLPVAELLSKARPYTDLLDEAIERLLRAVELVNGPAARHVWRMGIMSNTVVVLGDAPPGIRRLVDYIGRPWGKNLPQYNLEITGPLEKGGDDYNDRCIHTVGMGDVENNSDKLVTIKLDWQRNFNISRPLAIDAVRKHVFGAKKVALDYFEDVAEGTRFDEAILNKSA
jgi:hypothetical protein